MKKPYLSPSALSLFRDCPRCFWLDRNLKESRPRGIFPSLPGGMDLILKTHYDNARRAGIVPAELVGRLPGSLFQDQEKLERWRNWRTGLEAQHLLARVGGALDDLWIEPDGTFSPLDFKTKGSVPGGVEYAERYYQHQMDVYALFFRDNGMTPSGKAHLIFYSPKQVMKIDPEMGDAGQVLFDVTILTIVTDLVRATELIDRAASCLQGPLPAASQTCEYCRFAVARQNHQQPEQPAAASA